MPGFALKEHLDGDAVRSATTSTIAAPTARRRSTTRRSAPTSRAPVAGGSADRGIVIGGSGQGEQMAANKVRGVRAALCNDLYTARLSRQHNDANVLAMGGRIVGFGLADEIVALWLDTPFEGGRHQRRIDQIAEIERQQHAPATRSLTT